MMTKKDYELIAGLLNNYTNNDIGGLMLTDDQITTARAICKALANELRRNNDRFNKDKFLTACGVYKQLAD